MADVPESTELLPCPFCGNVDVETVIDLRYELISVTCDLCEIEGPAMTTREEAVAAWNTRKPAASPVAPPEMEGRRFHDDVTPLPCGCPTFYLYVRENNVACGKCGDHYSHPRDGVANLPRAAKETR